MYLVSLSVIYIYTVLCMKFFLSLLRLLLLAIGDQSPVYGQKLSAICMAVSIEKKKKSNTADIKSVSNG